MKNKFLPLILIICFFVFNTAFVSARDGSDETNEPQEVNETQKPSSTPENKILEINKERQKEIKEAVRERQEIFSESKTRIAASRESFLKEREEAREEFKEKLEEAKKAWEEKREELKEKLEKIKDERKKDVTENIADRINERNSKWVEHWNQVLDRLTKILEKMDLKAQEYKAGGGNISGFETKSNLAKTAISNAKAKISTQAGKTYDITIDSEANLGQNVKTALNNFHSNVTEVVESINQARQAVKEAFAAFREVAKDFKSSAKPTATP